MVSSASLAFLLRTVWPGRKQDLSLVRGLVLVDVADHGLDGLDAGGDLLRGLLRGGGLVAGVDGVLIGGVSLVGSELDASLGARVGVFDRLAVAGGQFIEFVDAVADRLGLAASHRSCGRRD